MARRNFVTKVWSTYGSEHYVYNGGERVLTLDQNGELKHRKTWGPGVDNLLVDEVFSAGNVQHDTWWAANDHLGSVNQLLDEDGDVIRHREYDSFGNIDHVFNDLGTDVGSAGMLSDVGFAGREWDDDAQLYYNRARWYDSNTGRFIGVDPIEDGDNWYVYAGSDPVNYRDPTGLSAAHPLDAFGGGYSGGSVAPAPTIVGGATPNSGITGFDGNSSYSASPNSVLSSAVNVLGGSSVVYTGTPSFNSGLASSILGSGVGSTYSSTGSYGSITDFGGNSYSSGSSFSNIDSALGDYLDPAFDFGQSSGSGQTTIDRAIENARFESFQQGELRRTEQEGFANLASYVGVGIDIATEFNPYTAGAKSIYNNGSVLIDSNASFGDKAYAAGNIAFDFVGGKLLKKGFDLAGAGAGAAKRALGYTDDVVESGIRNAPGTVKAPTGFSNPHFGQQVHNNFEKALLEQTGTNRSDWIVRTKPGQTGIDATYIGPKAKDPGFKHAELKPRSQNGVNAFNGQVDRWQQNGHTVPGENSSLWFYNEQGVIGQGHLTR